jgi:acyl-coenzyme A synthetase/AMP-(fatty) acid ligase
MPANHKPTATSSVLLEERVFKPSKDFSQHAHIKSLARYPKLYNESIRAFMKWGGEWPQKHDLSSLRLLGTVGEPVNPEAWMPKTRSGKIMRRLLKRIASGMEIEGDATTLEDFNVLAKLSQSEGAVQSG